jgi:hypothetical protein
MNASNFADATDGPAAAPPDQGGRYLHSEHALYRVEQVGPQRALLEDCRTGTLLDVPISHLNELAPVAVGGPHA